MAFTRDFLKALGVGEEAVEQIFAEHGKTVNSAVQVEAAKYSDYDTLKNNYETLGTKVKELEKLDPEKLQKEITTLTEDHKTELANINKAHDEAIKKMAVKMQLSNAQDTDLVLSQLDLSKIEMDDNNNIKAGFSEQYEALQKDKPFLFKEDGEPQHKYNGISPKDGNPNNNDPEDPFVKAAKQGAGLI